MTDTTPRSFAEVLAAARAVVAEVGPDDLDPNSFLIDCREPDEFAQGTIPGAIGVPRGLLEGRIGDLVGDPSTPIVLVCSVGARSLLAARSLQEMGYSRVASLEGGFERWKSEGRRWSVPVSLTDDQKIRYHRHTLMPEVGVEGQARLLDSSVLIVGAGGLGSPAAMYLAAAGVGRIGIVDFDVVDASNLQRQILHSVDRLGMPKVDSARETLTALNPDVKVVTYQERLSAGNALEIMSGYDVIVDGGDNFPTRYLVNDASLHLKVPVVHGAIFRFDGQASVFSPYDGPCYRCLFPMPPPPGAAPSCAEAGVFGVLPGVVGSIQAAEALKLLLGIGEPLIGSLLVYDALTQDVRTLSLARNPECPACADESHPPRLVDYDQSCTPAGGVARAH